MSSCTRPLHAWQSPSGKVFFTPYKDSTPIDLPCGQCIACRLARSRDWATRCVHEAKLHEESSFLTLTYDDAHLPANGSLVPEHLTNFFKRLRKHYDGRKIRYFACGEYGDKSQRPHYHCILFGCSFPNRKPVSTGKFPLYNDDSLSRIWGFGHAVIGDVTFESAAYCARYVCKKITGSGAADHYGARVPEFSRASNRPGIGADYFHKYYEDIATYGRVYSRGGHFTKPPRYYDKLASGYDVEHLEAVKAKRVEDAVYVDPWRQQQLDEFNLLQLKNKLRKYEDG